MKKKLFLLAITIILSSVNVSALEAKSDIQKTKDNSEAIIQNKIKNFLNFFSLKELIKTR